MASSQAARHSHWRWRDCNVFCTSVGCQVTSRAVFFASLERRLASSFARRRAKTARASRASLAKSHVARDKRRHVCARDDSCRGSSTFRFGASRSVLPPRDGSFGSFDDSAARRSRSQAASGPKKSLFPLVSASLVRRADVFVDRNRVPCNASASGRIAATSAARRVSSARESPGLAASSARSGSSASSKSVWRRSPPRVGAGSADRLGGRLCCCCCCCRCCCGNGDGGRRNGRSGSTSPGGCWRCCLWSCWSCCCRCFSARYRCCSFSRAICSLP
mmetsp:Transcript_22173/g.71499  ORF Transcript_22173/g.71499 Transcript_22173/m.71499 type:complete len:276 (-) Transcript_22173:90-917(-)